MTDFLFKTEPWDHQRKALAVSADAPAFALFMEQRTGKTKVVIDTAARLVRQRKLDGLLILAPNGVHRNWITDEIPSHLHEGIPRRCYLWRSDKSRNVADQAEREAVLGTTDEAGLFVAAVNIEALRVDRCYAFCVKFLQKRHAMLVIDESQIVASPGAQQTKRARALASRALYRRILTGTPATESPFQLYSQFACLDPNILGFKTYAAFKARYGEFSEGWNGAQGRSFPKLEGYRNVDELTKKIAPYSFRVRRDECADLPPKVYQKVYFQLTSIQRKVYNELREGYAAELADGRTVSAPMVLTRWLRLQQVASNFYPATTELALHVPCGGEGCDDCAWLGVVEEDRPIADIDPTTNPRLTAATEIIEDELDRGGRVVVWARFHQDLDNLERWLQGCYISYGRYDGTVSTTDRAASLKQFKGGTARVLLANPAAGGRGINLSEATLLLYYSNGFSLEQRLQSEDRAESIAAAGRDRGTQIIDLVAEDTVDEGIIGALREKRSLASEIAGDPHRSWL